VLDRPREGDDGLRQPAADPVGVAPARRRGGRPWRLAGMRLRGLGRQIGRRLASSLTRRIALLNLIGLLAMLLGFLGLNQTRESVIEARTESMRTQAEIMAAAVAASATVETDTLTLDPDKLLALQAGETLSPMDAPDNDLEFSVNPERVAPVLRRLIRPTTLRARVYDRDGALLLDTRSFFGRGDVRKAPLSAPAGEGAAFRTLWQDLTQSWRTPRAPVDDTPADGVFPEVRDGLAGRTTKVIRVNSAGQTIIYMAAPIERIRSTRGVLLLSTQEGEIDAIIADERVAIVFVFLIAAGVMLVLSVLLAGTIAEPVRRLSEAAERVRRGDGARAEIPDLTNRSDEIGQLSGVLRDMTHALYSRIEAIERFAADVAHELKNPLTSLRSAVETLPLARTEESRKRLLAVIEHDVKRLDRLISDISDASRLDAEMARTEVAPIDLVQLVSAMTALDNNVPDPRGVSLAFVSPEPKRAEKLAAPFVVMGHDSRLSQVLSNLVANAKSFSPPGGVVRIHMDRDDARIRLVVDDDGPGIPDHALERIFERFYTDRPEQGFGQNSGLGLSISRQIAEAHRGSLHAENRVDAEGRVLGARFVLDLPSAERSA
jgi:two-component system sensor histidine kinase ChvG